MRKQKRKPATLPRLAILIPLLLVACSLAAYLGQNSLNNPFSTRVYASNVLDFTFKYPKTWRYEDNHEDVWIYDLPKNSNKHGAIDYTMPIFTISRPAVDDFSLPNKDVTVSTIESYLQEQKADEWVTSYEPTKFKGFDAFTVTGESPLDHSPSTSLYIIRNGKYYIVSGNLNDEAVKDVLASFRFTE